LTKVCSTQHFLIYL